MPTFRKIVTPVICIAIGIMLSPLISDGKVYMSNPTDRYTMEVFVDGLRYGRCLECHRDIYWVPGIVEVIR